jgi:hypothetical protein
MTTFEDKLFALIHGLPVADEPITHLASGPSEPGAFQKFHEQIVFDHLMGKRSEPVRDEIPDIVQKILAPRDCRDNPRDEISALAKLFDVPGERIMPVGSGDLAKRFTSTTDNSDDSDEEVTEYSHGRVVAKFKNGVCISTKYVPGEQARMSQADLYPYGGISIHHSKRST